MRDLLSIVSILNDLYLSNYNDHLRSRNMEANVLREIEAIYARLIKKPAVLVAR